MTKYEVRRASEQFSAENSPVRLSATANAFTSFPAAETNLSVKAAAPAPTR